MHTHTNTIYCAPSLVFSLPLSLNEVYVYIHIGYINVHRRYGIISVCTRRRGRKEEKTGGREAEGEGEAEGEATLQVFVVVLAMSVSYAYA